MYFNKTIGTAWVRMPEHSRKRTTHNTGTNKSKDPENTHESHQRESELYQQLESVTPAI